MTHLTYIMAAYGLAVVIAVAYTLNASHRMNRARRKLAQIDPRAGRDRT